MLYFFIFREFYYFYNIYEPNLAKGVSMSFSAISITITSPILFFIILNDKNNNNRTLINQLVVSIMCCAMAWNLIVQTMTLCLYTFHPINNALICHLSQLLSNITCLDCLILHDAIIIVKYIFIFQLKNPTALQDDYWRIFINLWILSFCLITQVVYHVLPGRENLAFYLCIGKVELALIEEPMKKNYAFIFVGNITGVLHVLFWAWKTTFKYHNKEKHNLYKEYKIQFTHSLNKEALFHYVTHTIGATSLVVGMVYFPQICLQLNPIDADTYPNFILIYFQDLIVGNCCVISAVGLFLATKQKMLREMLQEIKIFVVP